MAGKQNPCAKQSATNSPAISSSSTPNKEAIVDINGRLCLKGNPAPWIENNPRASHQLVKHLELDFKLVEYVDRRIDDSIDELSLLTRLTLSNAKSFRFLPNSISTLRHLQNVEFRFCTRAPNNLGVLKTSLTNLSYFGCSITYLPNTISTLSNLTSLYIRACHRLTELPDSFGQLRSLKHLSILYCDLLECLPNSMSNLLNLETLCIENCSSLIELPVNLNVIYLKLTQSYSCILRDIYRNGICTIWSIPRGLTRLCCLQVTPDFRTGWFSNLKDCVDLQILHVDYTFLDDITKLGDLNQLVNLQVLKFHLFWRVRIGDTVEFPNILEGLNQLIILDIQDTDFKYLPWSITKLPKLRFLILPWEIRVHTLPIHLSDSVLVSVKGRHIRKPWKQLKQEIGLSAFPIVQGRQDEYPSTIAPPGYLSLQGDLTEWIGDNYESRLLVKMVELRGRFDGEVTLKSIGELPYLTHLYVTCGRQRNCHTDTITLLKHLRLQWSNCKSYPINLSNLSNLESLDLIVSTLPAKPYLPVSLKSLLLQASSICSLPFSMANLSNLHTLELNECHELTSLSPLNIVTLKTDWINKSLLPICLRHLEILHVKNNCLVKSYRGDCGINVLEHCLTKLVNLETFSLTCYHIKSLPSMAEQRKLRMLLLKDCFALKELQSNMDQLFELITLDISGTRIKYLPDNIIQLSKLQQLILPQCFTQQLPRRLEKVSIIDDTDKRYYENMGYFDSIFEPISCSSDDGINAAVNSTEGVHEEIMEEPIQGVIDEQICEQYAVAEVPMDSNYTMKREVNEHEIICPSSKRSKEIYGATEEDEPNIDSPNLEKPFKPAGHGHEQKLSKVSYSTIKRKENDHEIICPSSKRSKEIYDATEEDEPNIDSPCLEKPSKPAGPGHGHERKVTKRAIAIMETVENPFLEFVKESHLEVLQHAEVHLDAANQSNIVRPNASLGSFDFVKACYEGDPVRIDFSMNSSFDQLKESICKKFGLEMNKFKIKYLDEDQEWLLMTCVSDLTHALVHTSSSGKKFVRLSITDKGLYMQGELWRDK